MISRIFRGEIDNVAAKRKRQIDTLKIFNDNVLELREDVEYQVQFEAASRRMAIMVSLSPEFPWEKPVLRVSPPITHPWCNEHSEITGAPGLLNFTVHSDLGRVVQAIIREFSKNPPQLQEDVGLASTGAHRDMQEGASPSYTLQRYPEVPSTSYNTYCNSQYPQYSSPNTNTSVYEYNYTNSIATNAQTAQAYGSGSHHSNYVSNSSSNSLHNTSTAQYSSDRHGTSYINSHYTNANYVQPMHSQTQTQQTSQSLMFPELDKLSNEELRKLGDDEDSMIDFLVKHTQLKDLNASVDEDIDNVEKIAKENLSKETELKELQAEVAEKIETVTVLKTRYDNLIQHYNKLSEVFTPDRIKECLKGAADESHERSEKIAEDFLNRKVDVERFLSTYVECRKLGQARRTKEEKLAHQLNELKRAGY